MDPYDALRVLVMRHGRNARSLTPFGDAEAAALARLLVERDSLAAQSATAFTVSRFLAEHRAAVSFAVRWVATEKSAVLKKFEPTTAKGIQRSAQRAQRALDRLHIAPATGTND